MLITSIQSVYRTVSEGTRVTEWTTRVNEQSGKEYYTSRVYVLHLYNSAGVLETHSNSRAFDRRA